MPRPVVRGTFVQSNERKIIHGFMNVALIDKHPVFRTGIKVMLKTQFDDVKTLESGSMQTLGKVTELDAVDIIIIGLSEEQPEIDKTALKKMMKKNPLASFIVYAAKPAYEAAGSLMRMGVKGYLNKNSHPDHLVTCLNAVIAGKPYICYQ
jgi:DNA-binding NarL/FixJ family response regulator